MHLNEIAMERAIFLAQEAEATDDPLLRYANAQLSAVYVSMAKELRLGRIKSRVYSDHDTITPGPKVPPPSMLVESPGEVLPPSFSQGLHPGAVQEDLSAPRQ